jgi:hypothetical protein
VDYRDLNKITIKNCYPFLLVREILNHFNGAAVYTKFDFKNIYYKIHIRKGNEWETAFKIRYGHFEYKMMPVGFINAPAIFQTYINKTLANLIDINYIAYFNNILIYFSLYAEY